MLKSNPIQIQAKYNSIRATRSSAAGASPYDLALRFEGEKPKRLGQRWRYINNMRRIIHVIYQTIFLALRLEGEKCKCGGPNALGQR